MSCGTSAGQFRAPETSSAMDRNPILWAPSLFSAGVSGGKPCRDEGEWNIVYPNTQFKKEWGCHQAHMWARPPFRCGPCHSSTLLQPISMTINVSGPKRSNPVNWGGSSHCVSLCLPLVASEHWRVSPALQLCIAAISRCCSDWNKWQPWTAFEDKGISRQPPFFHLNLIKSKWNLPINYACADRIGSKSVLLRVFACLCIFCSRCACTSKRGMNSLDYDAQRVGLNIRSLRRLGSPSEDAEPVPS